MILYLIKTIPPLRKYYFNVAGKRFVKSKLQLILPHLSSGEQILDIGSGNGLISFVLREKGFVVTPLDIAEGQYHPYVKPILYDGKHMPFEDKSFNTGLLLTILHHTNNQEEIIKEAARTCKQLIIMEDVYKNSFQKYYLFFIDSLVNLFYSPCPHTNRIEAGWEKLFNELGLEIKAGYSRKLIGVKQRVWVLE